MQSRKSQNKIQSTIIKKKMPYLPWKSLFESTASPY